jgi:hypothetical protein
VIITSRRIGTSITCVERAVIFMSVMRDAGGEKSRRRSWERGHRVPTKWVDPPWGPQAPIGGSQPPTLTGTVSRDRFRIAFGTSYKKPCARAHHHEASPPPLPRV